ncbi:nitrite reductase large subunit NirB [Rhodococcus sp. IEGM 1401]|uniref:nitrite reductase large subunit NirB n=1 Tax=unclassified Rhodococcus (in: high G+C Gram-positive bacteria) TaxID=192944 RepID=UPI000B9BC7D0|nr:MULTISPECIES: nitrite reductase large subunit NirB [unclassified Rhodococcus (in: high G+C Gram-positive bacteria)]MCZ4559369.1 nitrite reductase large subunit NirB [Rhodococcus sp. IEGM 1401]MDI6629219.1 nitrite reductase large subunit NirB [Rhodococcus sp. (in: high G+C Gram-positive bacteria)]MDI9919678.1 nitrite reductase large subunit NirB [Rhodococcus sp. IEGM 1372]MDV8031948.1 nitrite reductase large subunit NirB [Rhodococcus sp. IEGM 1414]OZE31843.1 nitrite reductase (NAD(P)H) [Rhod
MKNAVVVGHGMVGHRFVEALRARDEAAEWKVTVLCEEALAAYDRVGLSSYVGAWDHKELALAGNDYPGDTLVEMRTGVRADRIDRDHRTVVTSAGDTVEYDALVLATGSYPFVPPITGHDLPACFVYRTLDDLDKIRARADAAGPGAVGVVVGGGLLGLEAANALKKMGMTPHVIEFAPRLMPLQVDEGGGALLARLVTELGLNVHVGVGTSSISENDSAGLTVELSDGSTIDAALLVFSAGVRPQDRLARESGLEVGERGGIMVDIGCSTSDPAVYAIGECAAVEGRCYGLVAPGYSTAEVVADRLLGGAAQFPGADMSTKLKLMGVDVASFGDAMAATPGALEVVFSDAPKGTYAKLVVTDDAKTLLGGILVGDASAYSLLRPLVGRELPGDPGALISPAAEQVGIGALPDDAEICSCNGVSKGAICSAIADGACDLAAVKSCTTAGTTCGGCLPSIKSLLAASGVVLSKSLCEHFAQSRAELYEIVRATNTRTFSSLIAKYGSGTGCDICKPVVASILASTSSDHILDGEQASLQDTNDHFLANIQKNGTYSVVPRMPGGECTPEQLIVIGEVARDFGLYTKVTGGQRIDMFGARVEQLPAIWKRLVDAGMESGQAYGKSLRTVKSCVGSSWCRYGVQDSVGMAVDLENRYRGLRSPHKIKFGVSGCARECAEARGKDVGIIATEGGWNLYVGGNGGQSPKHAQLLASNLDDATLVSYIDRYLMFYVRTADRLQRTAPWLESLDGGLDHLRAVVCEDSLGIGAELEADMERHVAGYKDEWAGVLEDDEKLGRFVSFVNAPDESDPTIAFDESGARKVPVLMGMPRVGA